MLLASAEAAPMTELRVRLRSGEMESFGIQPGRRTAEIAEWIARQIGAAA